LSLPADRKEITLHLLLLHNLAGNPFALDYPLWSIAVEWQVYFLFPLFVWLWRRLGDARAIALTTLLPHASLLVLRDTHLAALTVQYVALFALGMLAACIAFAPSGAVAAQRDRFPWPLARWERLRRWSACCACAGG
jgi:peptidoglycan/LPS O-acetylase OafA/YrhL